jgi:osmotically-inducible protein OsmY
MKKPVLFLFAGLLFCGACSPMELLGGAATVAGIAAVREGGIKSSVKDAAIQAHINDRWFRYDVETFRKLNLTVNQGRVLITGVVQDPEDRVEAVRLAWQVDGVEQVINEIRIDEGGGIKGFVRDNWISARLRTALTLDSKVQNLNYSIDTVDGTVYLMGIAHSKAELNRVVELARSIPYVKQVVSYIKMAGEPLKSGE